MKLEEIHKKKEQPKVPEGYFETFPDKILSKVQKEEKKSSKIRRLYIYWSVAASIALIISAVSVLYFLQKDEIAIKDQLSSVAAKQIENHQENMVQDNQSLLAYYEYVDLYIDEYEIEDIYSTSESEEADFSEEEELLYEEMELEQIIELL